MRVLYSIEVTIPRVLYHTTPDLQDVRALTKRALLAPWPTPHESSLAVGLSERNSSGNASHPFLPMELPANGLHLRCQHKHEVLHAIKRLLHMITLPHVLRNAFAQGAKLFI